MISTQEHQLACVRIYSYMIQQLHVNSHWDSVLWMQYRFYLCSAALFLKTFAITLMFTFSKFTGVHRLLSGMRMAE